MSDATLFFIMAFLLVFIVLFAVLLIVLNRISTKQQLYLKDVLNTASKASNNDMDALRQQVMNDLILFQTNVLNSIKGDFHQLNEVTVNRLVNIETKVNDSLIQGFEKTNKAFSNVLEQMARIDETQQNLKALSSNITSLQNVLSDKKTRGTYGEVELYSILESVFGNNEKRFSKQVKLSNDSIADCVIHAPSPLGEIVIDSKFPLENFNRIYDESVSKQDLIKIKNDFKKDVAKHIRDIRDKYIIPGETADIAYMFIPAEAVFAEIYGHYDELVQLSFESKVFLVSPTTLMAYITAIKAIYLGQERNDRVVEIQEEFIKLSREFDRFNDRFLSVTKDFDKTYKDIQNVTITSDKIVKRFKQIESVELEKKLDSNDKTEYEDDSDVNEK